MALYDVEINDEKPQVTISEGTNDSLEYMASS